MKRILLSLLVVGAVGITAFIATDAFFSDTETSAGNTFTAGNLDLQIDSQCTYNGLASDECGTWDLKDLIPTSDKFFNFSDVKPGDFGENTISMHVDDNDAYMCLVIDNMQNDDNGLTEPESELDQTGGVGQGELADSLHFFAWADDGDNVWEENEPSLFSNTEGPASDILDGVAYPLYTPQTSVFPGGETKYTGVYWCYGTLTANETNHTLSCDGSAETNITQSDSLTADLSFYVEQARNNPDFVCPELTNQNQTVVVNSNNMNGWFGYNDENDQVDNNLVSFVLGPSTPPVGTGSVQSIVTGTQRRNIATQLFGGTKLADITDLQFSTYQPNSNPGNTNRAAYLQFNVDFTNSNTWQKRLIWVPSSNGNASVVQDTWQTWDAYNGGAAMWGWSGYIANGNKWPDNNVNEFRSWNDIKTAWPNAKMLTPDAFFGLRFGEPYNDGFTGYADRVVVGINGSTTTYNFEQ